MAKIRVIINGNEVLAPLGATVLEAASQAGITIPTLCHHRALKPIGACRICVVDIKGQRNLQAACAFPIAEGMEIETENPRVVAARKLILDMLFSERNHYCPFCEASGDCELHRTWDTATGSTTGSTRPTPGNSVWMPRAQPSSWIKIAAYSASAAHADAASWSPTTPWGCACAGPNIHDFYADAEVPFGRSTSSPAAPAWRSAHRRIIDRRSSFIGRRDRVRECQASPTVQHRLRHAGSTDAAERPSRRERLGSRYDSGLSLKIVASTRCYDGARASPAVLRRKGKLEPASWSDPLKAVANSSMTLKPKRSGCSCSAMRPTSAIPGRSFCSGRKCAAE